MLRLCMSICISLLLQISAEENTFVKLLLNILKLNKSYNNKDKNTKIKITIF